MGSSRQMAGFCYQAAFREVWEAVSVVAFKSFSEEKSHMQPFKKVLSIIVLTIFIAQLVFIPPVFAQSEESDEFSSTLVYLANQQLPEGGFPGLSEVADPGTTARALLAFHAIGIDPYEFVSEDELTPIDFLLDTYESYIFDDNLLLFPGNAGLVLAGLSFFQAAPDELSPLILDTLQSDGSFSTDAVKDWTLGAVTDLSQALAILGLAAYGEEVPESAIDYLLRSQMEDGTWSNGFGSDPDTTALVVVALLSIGQIPSNHPVIQQALQYFRDTQLDNAGWRPAWDSSMINVDSTGWITLALITAGEDLTNWEVDGQSPQDALRTVIQPDGSIGENFVNVYSTVEALLGFANQPLIQVPSIEDASEINSDVNKAGLIVSLPDGNTLLRCVDFDSETISGYDLLANSGLELETSFSPSMGYAVCGVEGQGCKSDNCFCGMPNYWSYWHLSDGVWGYSEVGANTYQVQPGSVEGWSWGDQTPIVASFEAICGEKPVLFLPAVVSESTQPTVEVLLPLVESSSEDQVGDQSQAEDEVTTQPDYSQYILFLVIVLVLVAVIVIMLREKRRA